MRWCKWSNTNISDQECWRSFIWSSTWTKQKVYNDICAALLRTLNKINAQSNLQHGILWRIQAHFVYEGCRLKHVTLRKLKAIHIFSKVHIEKVWLQQHTIFNGVTPPDRHEKKKNTYYTKRKREKTNRKKTDSHGYYVKPLRGPHIISPLTFSNRLVTQLAPLGHCQHVKSGRPRLYCATITNTHSRRAFI